MKKLASICMLAASMAFSSNSTAQDNKNINSIDNVVATKDTINYFGNFPFSGRPDQIDLIAGSYGPNSFIDPVSGEFLIFNNPFISFLTFDSFPDVYTMFSGKVSGKKLIGMGADKLTIVSPVQDVLGVVSDVYWDVWPIVSNFEIGDNVKINDIIGYMPGIGSQTLNIMTRFEMESLAFPDPAQSSYHPMLTLFYDPELELFFYLEGRKFVNTLGGFNFELLTPNPSSTLYSVVHFRSLTHDPSDPYDTHVLDFEKWFQFTTNSQARYHSWQHFFINNQIIYEKLDPVLDVNRYDAIMEVFADMVIDENTGKPFEENTWRFKMIYTRGNRIPSSSNGFGALTAVYENDFFNYKRFLDIITSADSLESAPEEESIDFLLRNYPNPFNPSTKISYHLPEKTNVELTIYNILGQKIKNLVYDENKPTGKYTVFWDGTDDHGKPVSSGLYLYNLKTNTKSITKKMSITR